MQKIMFDDNFGLTRAVLDGRKTMTRRIIRDIIVNQALNEIDEDGDMGGADTRIIIDRFSRYKPGEVVAVAQSYKDAGVSFIPCTDPQWGCTRDMPGYNNKMFVRADLMPHQIRITDVRVERLQDISDEDCLREGVMRYTCNLYEFRGICYSFDGDKKKMGTYLTARDAFAALIKKMAGKKAWDDNPWAFVYEFELVK